MYAMGLRFHRNHSLKFDPPCQGIVVSPYGILTKIRRKSL